METEFSYTNISPDDLVDYKIEEVNSMNYNDKEMQEYIKANYNIDLAQYKKDLILFEKKYPNAKNITYDVAVNGVVWVAFIQDDLHLLTAADEIRNKQIYVGNY